MDKIEVRSEIARIHNSLKAIVLPFTKDESAKVTEAKTPEDFTEYYPNPDAPHANDVVNNAINDLFRLHKKLKGN